MTQLRPLLGSGHVGFRILKRLLLFDCVIGLSGRTERAHAHLFFTSYNHLPPKHFQAAQVEVVGGKKAFLFLCLHFSPYLIVHSRDLEADRDGIQVQDFVVT